VGAPRAATCVGPLAELNPYVSVSAAPGTAGERVPDDLVRRSHVVVLADESRNTALHVNALCRAASPQIGFIATCEWW